MVMQADSHLPATRWLPAAHLHSNVPATRLLLPAGDVPSFRSSGLLLPSLPPLDSNLAWTEAARAPQVL
jgi:hypothetical protein